MKILEEKELEDMILKSEELFSKEPNYLELPLDKPIVFVGDTHGDIWSTKKIFDCFAKDHLLVFLGDYIDRALHHMGSVKNISYLLEQKILHPENVILLRGNHEMQEMFKDKKQDKEGFFFHEIRQLEYFSLLNPFGKMFSEMPYVCSTRNGLIGLHGGIPNIQSADELKNIPKGVMNHLDNKLVSQILWSDSKRELSVDYRPAFSRNFNMSFGIAYSKTYFKDKMDLLGKNVLVRGHDSRVKGFSYEDRLLTIFSSHYYNDSSSMKGTFVAVMNNPKKEILTTKDLMIEYI
jgi:hypothetical protein